MNRENIQIVRDHIAGLPRERFDMATWCSAEHPTDLLHECGSAGCIGGWVEAVLRTSVDDTREAYEFLGLNPDAAGRLFFPGTRLSGPYERVTSRHAVRVLDHLLATGEVDWKSTRRAKKAAA